MIIYWKTDNWRSVTRETTNSFGVVGWLARKDPFSFGGGSDGSVRR